ncbi:MAG: hypothetical protein C6P35_11390 [Cohnella sp.]|uniref:hypothetical protein n=1 Tax=Cohnella sp. TaxID=1883426 RepID=UPI000E3776FD|nr:hypothetical protein [Cohnella sp.]REK64965.1 MAG: hypothetical protein C6P35_11390 [Cohnella sp.]
MDKVGAARWGGDPDSIAAIAIDSAVAEPVPIGAVALGLAVLAVLLALAALLFKRRLTRRMLAKAALRQKEAFARLNAMILSEPFKELNDGFVQGDTRQSLERLERAILASRSQAELLQQKIAAQRAPLLSLIEPLDRAGKLLYEANALAGEADRYERELAEADRLAKDVRQSVRQARKKTEELAALLATTALQTGYPLDELKAGLEQVQASVRQAELAGTFDALKAQAELQSAARAADALERRLAEFQKNAAFFREMQSRFGQRIERIKSESGREEERQALEAIAEQAAEALRTLEEAMRAGKAVNLRAAAVGIEKLLGQASGAGRFE